MDTHRSVAKVNLPYHLQICKKIRFIICCPKIKRLWYKSQVYKTWEKRNVAEVFHIIQFALHELSVYCSETKDLCKWSLVNLYKLKFMVGGSNYFTIGFPWLNNFVEYFNSQKICCRCQLLAGGILLRVISQKLPWYFLVASSALESPQIKYHRCSVE